MDVEFLENKAKRIRREVLEMAYHRGHGHIGGSYSIIEILLVLFDEIMNEKDKFILSKGHACLPYYILLREKGFNPKISGHPEMDPKNGIYCTTGSLGHGLPIGMGMAFAKKEKRKEGKVYVLLSDAECQEGTTWESCLIASHNKLENLTIIVDNNNMQTLGKTSDILSLGEIEKKFEAFGCDVLSVDGHSLKELLWAFQKENKGKPKVIIANTTKGKGVSYMENVSKWHTMIPDEIEYQIAQRELS